MKRRGSALDSSHIPVRGGTSSTVHAIFDVQFHEVCIDRETQQELATLSAHGVTAQLPQNLIATWRTIGWGISSGGDMKRSGITRQAPLIKSFDKGDPSGSGAVEEEEDDASLFSHRMVYSWDHHDRQEGHVEQETLQCKIRRVGDGLSPRMIKFKLNEPRHNDGDGGSTTAPKSRRGSFGGSSTKLRLSQKLHGPAGGLLPKLGLKPYRRLAEYEYNISECCVESQIGTSEPSSYDVVLPMSFRVPVVSSSGASTPRQQDMGDDNDSISPRNKRKKSNRFSLKNKMKSFSHKFRRQRNKDKEGNGGEGHNYDDYDENSHSSDITSEGSSAMFLVEASLRLTITCRMPYTRSINRANAEGDPGDYQSDGIDSDILHTDKTDDDLDATTFDDNSSITDSTSFALPSLQRDRSKSDVDSPRSDSQLSLESRERRRSASSDHRPFASPSSLLAANSPSPRCSTENRNTKNLREAIMRNSDILGKAQRELLESEQRYSQISGEIETLRKERDVIQEKLNAIREEQIKYDEKIRFERIESDRERTALRSDNRSMRSKYETMKNALSSSQQQLHEHVAVLERLQQQLQQQELERKRLESTNNGLREELEERSDLIRSMEREAHGLHLKRVGNAEVSSKQSKRILTLEKENAWLVYSNSHNPIILSIVWGLWASLCAVLALPSILSMSCNSVTYSQGTEIIAHKALASFALVSLFAYFGLEMARTLQSIGLHFASHLLRITEVEPSRAKQFISSAVYGKKMARAGWWGLCLGAMMIVVERIFFIVFNIFTMDITPPQSRSTYLTSIGDWLLYCIREALLHELIARLFCFIFVLYCLEYLRQAAVRMNRQKKASNTLESKIYRFVELIVAHDGSSPRERKDENRRSNRSRTDNLRKAFYKIPRTVRIAAVLSSMIFSMMHIWTEYDIMSKQYLSCENAFILSHIAFLSFEFLRTTVIGIAFCCLFFISTDIEYVIVGHLVYSLVLNLI